MLVKSHPSLRQNNKLKKPIIINVINPFISNLRFSKLLEGIPEKKYSLQGNQCEIKQIQNKFKTKDAFIVLLLIPITLLPTLFCSIFLKINIMQAITRSLIVYYRTKSFFDQNPCESYLTLRFNDCSPSFYLGFKDAGCYSLLAIENGMRHRNQGMNYSHFDYFFTLGQYSIDFYKSIGCVIKNSDVIGSLVIANNKQDIFEEPKHIDVLFIDQGFPGKDTDRLFLPYSREDMQKYLTHIKKFSDKYTNLNTALQLRSKRTQTENAINDYKEFFQNSRVQIIDNFDDLRTYKSIMQSKLIVTVNSTVGLEALSLGVKSLFLNHGNNRDLKIIEKSKFQKDCQNYENFESHIIKNLSDFSLIKSQTDYYIPYYKDINAISLIRNKLLKLI